MDGEEPHTGRRSKPLALGSPSRQPSRSSSGRSGDRIRENRSDRSPNFGKRNEKETAASQDSNERSSIVKDLFSSDFNIDSIIDRIKEFSVTKDDGQQDTRDLDLKRTRSGARFSGVQGRASPRTHRKEGTGLTLADLDKMENEIELLLGDIDSLENEMVKKSINVHERPEKPKPMENPADRKEQEKTTGQKISLEHPFFKWVKTKEPKRYIPIAFAVVAPLAYFIVTLRVIFKVPITRFVPVFIDPFHIFIMLLVVLAITMVANYVKRNRIKNANSKASPIWTKEVDQS